MVKTNLICPRCGNRFIIEDSYKRQRDGAWCIVRYCKSYGCGWRKLIRVLLKQEVTI